MRLSSIALGAVSSLLIGSIALLPGCKKDDTDSKLQDAKKKSIDNLVKIGLGLHNHYDGLGGFPSPGLAQRNADVSPRDARSWRVAITAFLDGRYDPDPLLPLPEEFRNKEVEAYKNPLGTAKPTETNYRVFVGNGAAFDRGMERTYRNFFDGLGKTILVVEAAEPVVWTSLDDFEYDPKKPLPKLGIFPGGFHALMADATVRWIPDSVDEATIRAMITRNGSEKFDLPGEMVGKPDFELHLPK